MRHDTALIPRNILQPLYAPRHAANLCSRNNIAARCHDISYIVCKSYKEFYQLSIYQLSIYCYHAKYRFAKIKRINFSSIWNNAKLFLKNIVSFSSWSRYARSQILIYSNKIGRKLLNIVNWKVRIIEKMIITNYLFRELNILNVRSRFFFLCEVKSKESSIMSTDAIAVPSNLTLA